MQISFIILFMIDLYKDNHVRACVRVCVCAFVNFFFKKNFPSETIDWTFTLDRGLNLLFIVTEE